MVRTKNTAKILRALGIQATTTTSEDAIAGGEVRCASVGSSEAHEDWFDSIPAQTRLQKTLKWVVTIKVMIRKRSQSILSKIMAPYKYQVKSVWIRRRVPSGCLRSDNYPVSCDPH
ncbi:hypothetical protein JG687_00016814 [Phytophthora cactorum]|uniref:Uncharacterized protein n=1 Tax=Phytophthora cactorum TaxID=29920 RepID=A0A8T1TS41_9STRA|nr:hypothetical protein JG687_00016814 [Phytophthora cactorum]